MQHERRQARASPQKVSPEISSDIRLGTLVTVGALGRGRSGLTLLSFAIGGSAGFIQLQFNGIHAYTFLVFLYIVVSPALRRGVVGQSVVLVVSAALVASTVMWGDLATTTGLALQLMVMAVSTALFLLRSTGPDLAVARYGLIAFTTIGALAAIGQAAGLLPAQLFQLAGAESHRPSGIYPEPDWLGLYSAVGLVLIWLSGARAKVRIPLIAVHLLGVMLASARAAIIGLVVVVVFSAIKRGLSRQRVAGARNKTVTIFVALSLASLVFVLAFPTAFDLALGRLAGLVPESGDAVVTARFAQTAGLIQFAEQAPWYGHGLSASGRVDGFGLVQYSMTQTLSSTGSNWLAGLWADAKLLAIPLVVFLVIAIFKGAGSAGSLILLLILVNSLASNAFFFPLTWFAIVLCLAAASKDAVSSTIPRGVNLSSNGAHLR